MTDVKYYVHVNHDKTFMQHRKKVGNKSQQNEGKTSGQWHDKHISVFWRWTETP